MNELESQRQIQLVITAAVLLVVILLMGTLNSASYAESAGIAIGTILLPLFNAHLFTKYIDSNLIKSHIQLGMLTVGILSLFVNSALIFVIILGAMAFSYFTSKKEKVKNNR